MIYCNTGYCTTLLYNKDVAFKRFLCECRLTKLNHVTLVSSVFLFYAFSSVPTLAYTTVGKTWLVSHTKHTQWKINRSTLFTIDNMYCVDFKI